MSWLRAHRRSAVLVLLTVLLPVLLYLTALMQLVGARFVLDDQLERLRPRVARLQGLIDHAGELRASAGSVDASLASLGYPPERDDTAVAASLQAEVRQVLADAGLEVTNSQVLPPRDEAPFELIGLKVTAQGGLRALDAALAGLNAFRPVLYIEALDVFPERGRTTGAEVQSLTAVIQLFALRSAT